MSTSTSLTTTEVYSLLSLSLACVAILANTLQGDGNPLIASIAFSGIAFSSSYALIRWLGNAFIRRGFKGRDMSKTKQTEIPETMGAVCAMVYLFVLIVFIPWPFYKDIVVATSGGGNRDVMQELELVETGRFLHRFPHNKLASYLSALLSLQTIVLLGIGDDLFDIRWRHKVLIPAIAAIPMLIVYFVDFGVTKMVVPTPLRPYLGALFDLGWLYYVYMALLSIFSANSINILAGINGIEVGQSLVIAVLIVFNDALYLSPFAPYPHPATDSHLFSLYLLLPFIGVSLALLMHNWFPARVFVGDTYCYFAGMVFAVDGILGHFSKTLILLLLPQAFNFVYSAPQLFHLVPCPRHRLPRFNARTGLLECSRVEFDRPLARPIAEALKLLHRLRLLDVETHDGGEGEEKGRVVSSSNFTLINLWLVWFGPMREDRLALGLLALQAGVGVLGLFVRHRMALLIFTQDNW
ncbi:N-acetylglucosaminephosphotransferas-like protein [Aaosphaeria arxii CBS 175.79]|uniref:UDP-N-acetylglucosamine--dolichyl-phosphate N-acetylglucosaminephosphotransferase n=1 Tax=Aaosphaeria arxii CBS 175.79 TaxID=1450172 RepID=A0A6A5Y1N6_9PLEO|nr:N-acetylglucosaminephosphotransferas-like protein [Aaosphaeria arxii CBS 175.79]KAF2019475.1 N-acetylglucosaminephosphotransferas-like protein [Aaosphaeria arxii CBS 175.79]